MHAGIVHGAVVDRLADARHVENGRFELDHVGGFHARNRAQPASSAACAQADHEGAARAGPQQGPQHPAHHLRGGIVARVAVDLPVHDKGERCARLDSHATLDALALPQDGSAHFVDPGLMRVDASCRWHVGAAHADAAVPPDRRRAVSHQQRGDHDERARSHQRRSPADTPLCRHGHQREGNEQQHDQPPAAWRCQQRKQPEAAGQGAHDASHRVPEIRAPDVTRNVGSALAQQGHKQRKLGAGNHRRRQHHYRCHDRPAKEIACEAGTRRWPQAVGEKRELIAEHVWQRDRGRLEQAGHGKGRHAGRPSREDHRVAQTAERHSGESDSEHKAEGVDSSSQNGPKHAIPHQFHQEEGEAHESGSRQHETSWRDWLCLLARPCLANVLSDAGRPTTEKCRRTGDQQVRERGQPQRGARAAPLEEPERRNQTARDSSECVQSVEQSSGSAARVCRALDGARGSAQSPASKERGQQQHETGQHQSSRGATSGAQKDCAAQ